MVKVDVKGRQYSKRRITVQQTEYGLVELCEVKLPRVRLATLATLKGEALEAIQAAGFDPHPHLADSPHGSGLRDAVINYHDKPADDIAGLAARIYELAAHVEGYRELGAIDRALNTMGELGALVTLFDIYRQVSTAGRDAGKKGARHRPSKEDDIKQMAARLKADYKDPRRIAGIIAERLGVTAHWVRTVLKKA